MANITPTVDLSDDFSRTIPWTGMTPGDIGLPPDLPTYVWKTGYVQNSTVNNVTVQASIDGVNWENQVNTPGLGITTVPTGPKFLRIAHLGSTGTTTVTMFLHSHYGN